MWNARPIQGFAYGNNNQRYRASVYLSRLVNWGTFDRAEFANRAGHLPTHPKLLAVLREPADVPQVDLGNLRPLL